jgi:pimeloyl-ACP methyl ester carboxylesterase
MQLIAWPEEFVQMLLDKGLRVIRFDNRDIGLSQGFDAYGMPWMPAAFVRHALHLPVQPVYSLADMARDALGVLDAVGVIRAHVVGASMGGMIAQHLAAGAPERTASLTLMMTSSGARGLPEPPLRIKRLFMRRPMGPGVDAALAWVLELFRAIGSPAYPIDPALMQARMQAAVARSWHPAGSVRQVLAVLADRDRTPLLGRIAARTLVIHGRADPLVPLACGEQLVRCIPGARAEFIEGMGHDLPPQLLPRLAEIMARHFRGQATGDAGAPRT